MGPLWLNALRYGTAALVLIGYRLARSPGPMVPFKSGNKALLGGLIGLGLLNYAVSQGGITLGLHLLPSSHVALILNLNNTAQVLLFSALILREVPAPVQWAGLGLGMAGTAAFYYPLTSPPGGWMGVVPVLVTGVGYAITTIYTRRLMRAGTLSALDLTVISMTAGAAGMSLVAFAVEGVPALTLSTGLALLWLAVINTAFTFTLWAHTQKVLVPFETSTLNNTMLVQIALLSWWLLDEPLTGLRLPGVIVVSLGTLLVQVGPHFAQRMGRSGPATTSRP